MSLVAFASAKGSPGVTRALTALAPLWPRDAVVADLDPAGGDLDLLERDVNGDPLATDTGLLSLGAALRGGKAADVTEHVQETEEGSSVLVGITPGQVQGLGPVWPHIASAFAASPVDVLADCGRLVPGSPVQPVVEAANALVLVARHDVPSLAHLRERLLALREPLSLGHIDGTPIGVVLVGDPRDARAVTDMVRLLASAGVEVEGLGTIAHDPRTVATWATAPDRARQRSLFHRSLVDVSDRIAALAGRRAERVAEVV